MTQDEIVGTGTAAVSKNTLTVNYIGTFQNGAVFDSSFNPGRTPFQFQLGVGQVIAGWDEGIVGMRVGGKRKLLIPAALAYGTTGKGNIPPNTPLVFEVTLVSIP